MNSFFRKILAKAPYWVWIHLPAAWLSLGLLAYSMEWRQWPSLMDAQHVGSEGGRQARGRLLKLSGSGFGRWTDYHLRVEGANEDYYAPAMILNDLLAENSRPRLDLASQLREGDIVQILTLGGTRPITIEILKEENGGMRTVLDKGRASRRFNEVHRGASKVADTWRLRALAPLAVAAALHLACHFHRRRRRSQPGRI